MEIEFNSHGRTNSSGDSTHTVSDCLCDRVLVVLKQQFSLALGLGLGALPHLRLVPLLFLLALSLPAKLRERV